MAEAALVISLFSLVAAIISAVAAIASANSAKESKNISRSDLLTLPFQDVKKLWFFVRDGGGANYKDVNVYKTSMDVLKQYLNKDTELIRVLESLGNWLVAIEEARIPIAVFSEHDPFNEESKVEYRIPDGFDKAFKVFEQKRKMYLGLNE